MQDRNENGEAEKAEKLLCGYKTQLREATLEVFREVARLILPSQRYHPLKQASILCCHPWRCVS